MRAFGAGVVGGLALGVFFGFYLSHFSEAVRATAIGFGAGLGIFALGALVRVVAGFTNTAFSELKQGKRL